MYARNAVSVLPDTVGAEIDVLRVSLLIAAFAQSPIIMANDLRRTVSVAPAKSTSRGSVVAVRVLASMFAIVAAIYIGSGLLRLVTDVPGSFPIDLRLRWIEERLFVAGIDPQVAGHPDPLLPASHEEMRTAGGSYPPWAYTLGLAFAPPIPWSWARWYAGLIACVAILVFGAFAHTSTATFDAPLRWLSTTSVLANFSIAICVSYGQYAVPILGLLSGSVWLLTRGREVAAGLALGLAMVKPQLSALFLLTLLLTGRARTLVVATIVVGVSTVTALAVLHVDLGRLLANSGREAELYYRLSHNPLLPLLVDRIGFRQAVGLLGAVGLVVTTASIFRLRRPVSPLRLVSIACVVTMFWTYRKHYDVVLMSLPLLELWRLTLASIGSTGRWLITLLVGMTLWIPLRDQQWHNPVVAWGQLIIWLAAGVWLVVAPAVESSPVLADASDLP